MPTILRIGYQSYVVKNEAAAMKALQALCGAVKVRSRHLHLKAGFREVYWPESDSEQEISIRTVSANQLLPCDPGEDPGEDPGFKEPKRLTLGIDP